MGLKFRLVDGTHLTRRCHTLHQTPYNLHPTLHTLHPTGLTRSQETAFPLGPHSRLTPRALWWSLGGGAISYERSTPAHPDKWGGAHHTRRRRLSARRDTPSPYPTPYTLHPNDCNRHNKIMVRPPHLEPYTLHITPCTLHPLPYTLQPTPYTPHPTLHTLHPTPLRLGRTAHVGAASQGVETRLGLTNSTPAWGLGFMVEGWGKVEGRGLRVEG